MKGTKKKYIENIEKPGSPRKWPWGKKTLITIIFGISLIAPPVLANDFPEKYGKILSLQITPSGAILGYDTDGDEVEDLRMVYENPRLDGEGGFMLGLRRIYKDKNKDGYFKEDEIIWPKKGIPI